MGAAMLGGAVMAGRASQRASTQRQDQEAQQAQAEAPPPPAAAPAASGGIAAQLQQLADLKQSGVLSDEEFEAAKQKLLAS
jgi:Short C-terminal domain